MKDRYRHAHLLGICILPLFAISLYHKIRLFFAKKPTIQQVDLTIEYLKKVIEDMEIKNNCELEFRPPADFPVKMNSDEFF